MKIVKAMKSMDILPGEERKLNLLKSINIISISTLKFLVGLLAIAFLILVINGYFGSNLLVKDIADRSMAISFWMGLALLFLNDFVSKKIANLDGDEFSEALEDIDNLSDQLQKIRKFLKETQGAIIDTHKELKGIEKEKDLLEPILKTNRDDVKKILLAQSHHQHAERWKERTLSFASGIAASIIATMVYDKYF